jgi:predicted phosphodiesterase
MILGVFSDLHSNRPALIKMQEAMGYVDRWISLGDSVGLFPSVNAVLDWQRGAHVLAVAGDHESHLLSGQVMEHSYTGNAALEYQRRVLTQTNREYLVGLGEVANLLVDGIRLHFSHAASKECLSTHSEPGEADFDRLFPAFDFAFLGHSHLPSVRYGRNIVVLNPGSAGFPIDVLKKPSAIRFDTSSGCWDLIRFEPSKTDMLDMLMSEWSTDGLAQYVENGFRWETYVHRRS